MQYSAKWKGPPHQHLPVHSVHCSQEQTEDWRAQVLKGGFPQKSKDTGGQEAAVLIKAETVIALSLCKAIHGPISPAQSLPALWAIKWN